MMKKEFKICPITKFIAWLILGLIVCIIGITNVFADTYSSSQFSAQLYDNNGPSLSAVTTDYTNGRWQGTIPTMTANSSGAAWGISSPVILIANHTYSLTAKISGSYGGNIRTSTYNRIGVGTTLANAKTSYQNNTYVTENYSGTTNSGDTIQFAFTPTTNGNFIVFAFSTTSTGNNWSFYLYDIVIDDLGSSGGVSQSDINNSLSTQTNTLNQSITNSQNTIIQNQNQNAEDTQNTIINNGSQDIINNSLNSCGNQIKFTLKKGKQFTSSGGLQDNTDYYYTSDYTAIGNTSQITFVNTGMVGNDNAGIILVYDSNYNYLDWWSIKDRTINLPSGSTYFKLSTKISTILLYQGSGCVNKLDETNNNLSNILGNITNTDAATFDSSMINLIPNAPITNLLTIPISLMQNILTRTNNSCSPISIPFLYNNTINFPCFTLNDYLGDASHIIDMCICFVMIYNILMLFVSVFEDITSLRDEFHTLYAPKQLQLKIK